MADDRSTLRALRLVAERDEIADLDVAERRLVIREVLLAEGIEPGLIGRVAAIVDGYGAIDRLMRDDEVTDILINGPDDVWFEKNGALHRAEETFEGPSDLAETVARLVARGRGRVDTSFPLSDVRLPDGSRMHVALPPLTDRGPKISIRKFPSSRFTLAELREMGMFDRRVEEELRAAVAGRLTLVIGGGTGSGKTTLLNALLGEIGDRERVVTIEETPELRPRCRHSVALFTRPPNVEGSGAITAAELLRAALRMRPDRIVVGEVRGGEAVVALDAMSTGHAGSFLTVHARSAARVRSRLVGLAAATGQMDPDLAGLRFDDAVDMVLFVAKVDGCRRLVEVLEADESRRRDL